LAVVPVVPWCGIVEAVNRWLVGARLRTLPAAVVPVALGAACAVGLDGSVWWRAGLALLVSLALQVGVNYANDFSDGVRGTDDIRVGPARLVGGGLASPRAVKRAAFAAFGVAAIAGAVLALVTTLWLIPVGLAAILAGWFYTGGANPYGYIGLGEVFVFVFFGLVATVGTTFAIAEKLPGISWVAGTIAGLLACALLVINNLRDIPTDRAAGKRTLAVRLGDQRTRWLYIGLIAGAAALVGGLAVTRPLALFGLVGLPLAAPSIGAVHSGAKGRDLIPVLAMTGRTQMAMGLLTALGIAVGG
jgi:1,4-dihydroxy-2-naphthoate polyprenyltransferase